MAAAAVVKPKGLNCPSCGAALEVRGFAHTLNIVCPQCLSVLDAKDPTLRILQEYQSRERFQPLIPLGTRAKIAGGEYEAIGFQVRAIFVEGERYAWGEYLLFNPYKGFRYLTEYNGHWNLVRTLPALPQGEVGTRPAVRYGVDRFKHFQSAEAQTIYVMGEFPWQVRTGETVRVDDYIAPPRMLSAESTEQEIVWSLGEYVKGEEIWKAFRLPGHPPPARGVYANQPAPFKGGVAKHWALFAFFEIALLLAFGVLSAAQLNRTVFQQRYSFSTAAGGETSFVTPMFELTGHTSNVEVEINSNLDNNWAYLNMALINEATGEAYDFGREISYYYGRDSDGSWTEGSPSDSVILPSVPAGRYYLRIEPEMDTEGSGARTRAGTQSMNYAVMVKRDVPNVVFLGIAFLALLIPPIVATVRRSKFEKERWSESDYGG